MKNLSVCLLCKDKADFYTTQYFIKKKIKKNAFYTGGQVYKFFKVKIIKHINSNKNNVKNYLSR